MAEEIKVKPPKLKLPVLKDKVKLKDAKDEHKVLLALICWQERRKSRVTILEISQFTGLSTDAVAAALTTLLGRRLFMLTKAYSPVDFEFQLPLEVVKAKRAEASSYHAMMERKAKRRAIREAAEAKYRANIPAHLQRVPSTEWRKFLKEAEAEAQRMQRPVARNLAICMARIGVLEVSSLVTEALATHKVGSLRQHFFRLYEVRRDQLLLKQ